MRTEPASIPSIVNPHFGQLYGCGPQAAYVTTDGTPVWMWRKGQRVRFYDAAGEQVGPEHRNVCPAIVWAASNAWFDPTALELSLAVTIEVRANSRQFNEKDPLAGAWRPMPEVA